MWKRKELKTRAKEVVKKNYWTAIVVCFIIALFTGEFGTSTVGIRKTENPMDLNYVINNENMIISNVVEEEKIQEISENAIFDEEKLKEDLNKTQVSIIEAVETNLDNATKPQKYMLKIWDAITFFNLQLNWFGIVLCIAAVFAVIFTIFVADPLIVGGKKYFLKARMGTNTKVGTMVEVFKRGNWFNIAIVMLLRNVYNALWYLTIIGGIIKTYEYRMIPYILAENSTIKRKDAFKLSKQMMRGNKWRVFIFDMSFFGWYFLSVLTFGLLSILYVNPYSAATNAELYMVLRNNAIKEKYECHEQLNDKNLK